MGRNNYSYNGMLSVITRKPIYRYKARQKIAQEVVNELRESGNQRKVGSVTNIISTLFSVPEVYLERNYAGPKIDLTGNSNVSMNQDGSYSDLGASSSEATGSITVDDSNLDPTTPGVYYVTYTATDTHGFSRSIKRHVVVEGFDSDGYAPNGTPSDPIILELTGTSPFLNTSTLYRGKTYRFKYSGVPSFVSAGVKLTTQTTSPATNAVAWEIGIIEYSSSSYTTWTVPETCPDTMYWYIPEDGKESNKGTLTIAYPTDRPLPTRYKIRWLDPDQVFPAKIDRDNIYNAFACIENLFTERRPEAEAAKLHFDTTMTMANNVTISADAAGEPDDVVVLNILAGGATVNVYSNTSISNTEWNTDETNHGKITVNSIIYDEGRDQDSYGVYNNRDPQSLSFTPEYTIFTGSKIDAAMKWQGSSNGYYISNAYTTTSSPLYKASTNTTTPTSGYTVSDGEPWALSTAVICGRRQAGWDEDSGIVLLNAQGGWDGNITLSTHENKESGAFYAKFKYGTSSNNVEITTSNVTYNHYYTGFYVDYNGSQGFRMFTYDYKTDILTQVPLDNVVVTGIIGPMRAANFEVAKTPGADRYWNGRISHVTLTTLRTGVALPTNAEVLNMIKRPDTWLTTYKVSYPFRLPGAIDDDVTSVSPIFKTLGILSGTYFTVDGSLLFTQGTYSSPTSITVELERGSVYKIDISGVSGGRELRLSTSSVYHVERSEGGSGTGLSAAQANLYSSNVTYTADTITISAGDDTPDFLYLFDNLSVYPQALRDGPLKFTGSGFPLGSVKTSFIKRSFGGDDTTEVQKSARATKVYYFTGNLAGGPGVPFPEERLRNDVSYDATEDFLVSN